MTNQTTPVEPDGPVGRIESQWKKLLPAATLIIGVIGNFWQEPPPGLGEAGSKAVTYFSQFVVTIFIGLMVLPMMKWSSRKKHAFLWGKIAAIALLAGIVAFFSYQYLAEEWTYSHAGKVLYVGSELREDVREFVQHNPNLPRAELFENAGWDPTNIWTEKSLHRRRLVLTGVYVLCTPLFAIAIMAVVQILYCSSKKR
jgi:hypothetical protein